MRTKNAYLLGAFIYFPCVGMQAFAADTAPATTGNELEEVTITAERRTTDIQSTAASVSVRSGDELATQGRYTTRQILEDIPGIVAVDNSSVNVGTGDVQGNNITIRGISSAGGAFGSPSGISRAPGAAVYVDGVYEGVGSGYDIDRVEVLRGPQGTLYGRSATTGVVAFHTRNPSLDGVAGNASVEVADYDLQHYSAGVNIPLSDTLAARVSGDYRSQGDSYYDRARTGGLGKRTNGRAKLLWEPNEAFSLLAGFAYEKRNDFSGGNSTTASPGTLVTTTTISPIFGPAVKEHRQYWAEASWDVGPTTITYLPAFRAWEQNDLLFVSPDFRGTRSAQYQNFQTPKDHFVTHELRVASRDDSAVQWQAGVFYYRDILANANHNYLVPAGTSTPIILSDSTDQKDTMSLGYFAETTIPLNDSMRMTLGARYDDTKVLVTEFFQSNPYAACGGAAAASVVLPPGAVCTGPNTASVAIPPGTTISGIEAKYHNFNYKARLEYDLTPKNMLYGMISTGSRPGDVSVVAATAAAPARANILDAEKLTSIEVGSKNRFLDDSLQLNVGVFYYNYKGFQTTYRPNTPSPSDYAGVGATAVQLTVPAKNVGGELEMLYRLTPQDRVGFNYNYVQSKWYDKPAGFASAQRETKRALTPITYTANYEHLFNLPGGSTLSARIDGRYEAAHLTSNLHVDLLRIGFDRYVYIDSRTIGNLNATWASNGGRYSIGAYVRNFTDKQYTSYGVGGDIISLTVATSDPRTYGAQASVRF